MIKLGIVGSGKIVKDVLPVIAQTDVAYKMIFGRPESEKKVRSMAKEYHLDRCVFDYDELLKSDVNTVYIALPNHLHFVFAKKALVCGKHVILEKPITANYEEFQELQRIAKEKKLILLEALTIPFLPAYEGVVTEVERLGDLKIVSLNFSQYSSRYDDFKRGKIAPAFDVNQAGGALMDLNVYNLYFAVSLFGKPASVCYDANIENVIDTSGILTMNYRTFQAVCIGAKDCQAPIMSTLQGNKGSIAIYEPVSRMTGYEVTLNGEETEQYSFGDGESQWLWEFQECFRIIEELDYERADQLLACSGMVSEILTKARRRAGISQNSSGN